MDISLIWNFLLADATATFGDWHLSVRLSVCEAGYCERNNEHSIESIKFVHISDFGPRSLQL